METTPEATPLFEIQQIAQILLINEENNLVIGYLIDKLERQGLTENEIDRQVNEYLKS